MKKLTIFLIALAIAAASLGGFRLYDQAMKAETQDILERNTRDGVLIYGAHESAPPLRFVDSDGVYKGVAVDYINQLSLEIGVEIDVASYPWDVAQEKLKNGETDLCDMFANEERSKYFVFTEPIYNLRVVLAVEENSPYSLSDLNSMTVATERGDYANSYLLDNYPGAKLVYVKDVREGVELLSKGLVDAAIGDEPVVYYYMNKVGDFRFRVINTAIYEEPAVLALPKEKAELIPVLNRAIRHINKSGALEKIQQKWFGLSVPLLENNSAARLVAWFAAALLAVAGLLAVGQWNNRRLKQQVRERTKVLEQSQNELQLIFDGIPEYIVVLNREKHIVRANQGFLEYLQLELEQVTDRECRQVLSGFCQDCGCCILERCIAAKGVIKEEVAVKKELYEVTAYPLDGIEEGGLVTLRNITLEQVQKKQLLQSSKMMAVGQLAAGMAHEIRNPLGIIRTQSYLLQTSENLDEHDRKSLAFIDESVKRAGRIIDNVMNFWRSSENREETLLLEDSLGSIAALQGDRIRAKKARLEISCPQGLTLRCDPDALKHILLNLVSNSLDAISEGGSLLLSAEEEEGELLLRCRDDGCGIPPEDMENLFNPFFTTKAPGKGTGLGMFIVYSEVEKLGGTIQVNSQPGEGAEFLIKIPRKAGQ